MYKRQDDKDEFFPVSLSLIFSMVEISSRVVSVLTVSVTTDVYKRQYLTLVAIDADGKPTPVPGLIVESVGEQAEWEAGKKRKELRLSLIHIFPCRSAPTAGYALSPDTHPLPHGTGYIVPA